MPLPLNYMNSNFYYVHNFFCVFVHLGLTIFRQTLRFNRVSDEKRTARLSQDILLADGGLCNLGITQFSYLPAPAHR